MRNLSGVARYSPSLIRQPSSCMPVVPSIVMIKNPFLACRMCAMPVGPMTSYCHGRKRCFIVGKTRSTKNAIVPYYFHLYDAVAKWLDKDGPPDGPHQF